MVKFPITDPKETAFDAFLQTGDCGATPWSHLVAYILYIHEAELHLAIPEELIKGNDTCSPFNKTIQQFIEAVSIAGNDLSEVVERATVICDQRVTELKEQIKQLEVRQHLLETLDSYVVEDEIAQAIHEFALLFGYDEARVDFARHLATESVQPGYVPLYLKICGGCCLHEYCKTTVDGVETIDVPKGYLKYLTSTLQMVEDTSNVLVYMQSTRAKGIMLRDRHEQLCLKLAQQDEELRVRREQLRRLQHERHRAYRFGTDAHLFVTFPMTLI